MAKVFKRVDRNGKQAKKYSIRYKTAAGTWKTVIGCEDYAASQRTGRELEAKALLARHGAEDVDLKAPLPLKDFESDLRASGRV